MDKVIEHIKSLRDDALRNYALSERGIATLKEQEEAEEDIVANYYDEDKDFIMSRVGDICEHYIEQQEYLYYQGVLDGIEMIDKNPEISKCKNALCALRG